VKVAILDTYYPGFLTAFYENQPGLEKENYEGQRQRLIDACFGTSDFYSRHLNALGCEAVDLIANAVPLQFAWAIENKYSISKRALAVDCRITRAPLLGHILSFVPGLIRTIMEQIRRLKPDVLYCQDMSFLPPRALKGLKEHVRLIAGQIASPPPRRRYLESFDLILTSFPHFVGRFRDQGLSAEYFRIAFDTRVLERLGPVDRDLDATFVGGITSAHSRGTALLERLALETPVKFFGYGRERLAPGSPVHPHHHGEVWGLDMYRILARSRVTLNRHIDVAESYANNMRLYEATGVGAMLLTDQKDNLADLFEPGREVVAYGSAAEAAELIRFYLANPTKAADIARAGQRRTLREHTYEKRMGELVPLLRRHLH